jgi:hypothetical protein
MASQLEPHFDEDGSMIRYCVDGRDSDDFDAPYVGDGEFAPFVIFDIDAQENPEGYYPDRATPQTIVDQLNEAVRRQREDDNGIAA